MGWMAQRDALQLLHVQGKESHKHNHTHLHYDAVAGASEIGEVCNEGIPQTTKHFLWKLWEMELNLPVA